MYVDVPELYTIAWQRDFCQCVFICTDWVAGVRINDDETSKKAYQIGNPVDKIERSDGFRNHVIFQHCLHAMVLLGKFIRPRCK